MSDDEVKVRDDDDDSERICDECWAAGVSWDEARDQTL